MSLDFPWSSFTEIKVLSVQGHRARSGGAQLSSFLTSWFLFTPIWKKFQFSTYGFPFSDSSESDSSDDSDVDSDYETKSSSSNEPGSSKSVVKEVPDKLKSKLAPPPKKGMVLVRKKKVNQAEVKANEELEKKKKMLAYTQGW